MIFGLQALAFRILQLPPMEYGTQAAPELPSTEPTQDKAVSLLSFLLYRLISDLGCPFPPQKTQSLLPSTVVERETKLKYSIDSTRLLNVLASDPDEFLKREIPLSCEQLDAMIMKVCSGSDRFNSHDPTMIPVSPCFTPKGPFSRHSGCILGRKGNWYSALTGLE